MLTLEDKKDIGEIVLETVRTVWNNELKATVKEIVDDAVEKSAIITKNSFDHVDEEFAKIHQEMATKKDLENLRKEMVSTMASKEDLANLEHSLSTKYDHKIDRLQDDVRVIKTKLKIV